LLTIFDTPHAHPPAYERLYRLRVDYSQGGGYQYWPIPDGKGFRMARMDIRPHPDAVAFADAIAASLLAVLEKVEETNLLSPMLTIFNDYAVRDLSAEDASRFCSEILRWLFLGSPDRIFRHLGESYRNAYEDLGRAEDQLDRRFFQNSIRLTDALINKAREIKDYSVQRELQTFCRLSRSGAESG
jgi:hypothetical protein